MPNSQSYNLNTLVTTYNGQDPQGDIWETNQATLLTGTMNMSKVTGKRDAWEMVAVDNFTNTANFQFSLLDGSAAVGAWVASNNQISSPTGDANNCLALFNGIKLNDGHVSVIYENPDSTKANWCGLALRANSNQDLLLVLVFNTKVDLWKSVNGVLTQLGTANFATNDVTVTTGVPMAIEAEIIGLTINIYVNGRLMLTSTHSDIGNYLYGQCGLVTDKARSFTFSNFLIRKKRFDAVPATIRTVVCVGSSITYGYNVSKPWCVRFGENLSNKLLPTPVTIINGGINGSPTSDMLNRLPGLISANNPDMVVIECSVNDMKDSIFTTYTATLTNLRKMVKLVKQAGAIPLLTTITPIGPTLTSAPDWSPNCWRRVYQMNARVRQLAYEENVRLIDNALAFSNDLTLVQGDTLHPNDNGAQLMADTAFSAVIL